MKQTIAFSSSTMWFYDTRIYSQDSIPAPYVFISCERHSELLRGVEQGMTVSADENGDPVLVEFSLSAEEAHAAAVNCLRDRLIEANSIIAPLVYLESLNQLSKKEAQSLSQWRQYTVEVGRVSQQAGWPFLPKWPDKPALVV